MENIGVCLLLLAVIQFLKFDLFTVFLFQRTADQKICKLRILGKKRSVKLRTDHIFVYNAFLTGSSVISVS